MKLKFLSILAATTSMLVLGAGAASALTPYTVSVGGSTAAGVHSFTATTSSFVTNIFSCTSATLGGTVTSGPSAVNPIISITSLSVSGCGGHTASMAASPWDFYGTGPATTSTTGDIAGEVTGVSMHVGATPIPAVCSFDVTGFSAADFDGATQTLNLDDTGGTGDLVLTNVSGCAGQWNDGDPLDVSASFPLSVPDGAVNVFWSPTSTIGGSSAAGSHTYTGAANSFDLFNDSLAIHCTGASLSGTAISGPGPVNPYLTSSAVTTSGCVGTKGVLFNFNLIWTAGNDVYAVGPATSAATDDVRSWMDAVSIHAQTTPLAGVCSFDVSGFSSADFNEPVQVLNLDEIGLTGHLIASNVVGCLGVLNNGDALNLTAGFALSIPDGPLNLS